MNQIAKELREAADYMKREGVDLLGAVIRLNNTFDAINPGTPAANLGAINQIAKELREAADYMKREGVDLLGAVIRLNNTFDAINPGTPAANLGAIVAYIADELDELDDKATRRRSHIVKLESTIAERNRELRDLRKQVPTEREREILDMWPKFEDGEPVWFGDEMNEVCGKVSGVYFDDDAIGIYARGSDHLHLSVGERVKRPVQSVPDADGVEIKVGDTVYLLKDGDKCRVTGFETIDGEVFARLHCDDRPEIEGARGSAITQKDGDKCRVTGFETIDGEVFARLHCDDRPEIEGARGSAITHRRRVLDADGVEIGVGDTVWLIPACAIEPDEPYEVTGINKYGEVMLEFHVEGSTGVKGECLTHTRPDSWERLEEDAAKGLCEYFGFLGKECDAGKGCPAYEQGSCAVHKAEDIIRRAKALAGVEAE